MLYYPFEGCLFVIGTIGALLGVMCMPFLARILYISSPLFLLLRAPLGALLAYGLLIMGIVLFILRSQLPTKPCLKKC
ncbi:Transmembrane domain-containing protein [Cedratvirus Zaza IHUMI]|uniref:Transmembrane domain-containing protein n=1 Tax=Cedratvirus Zaza IHUMI TaxID=2126979 RepID=A0A2R8FCX2_9VIRU|nr:Transmembrane domain-containing protein [Cedratvirus Zaza IHUMI]